MLNSNQDDGWWQIVTSILYTLIWSASFHGQIYENFKLKSVEGFSLNFLIMNFNGYIFYGIYSTLGFFTDIKGAGTVVIADLCFAYHALIMVFIGAYQSYIYPHGKNRLSGSTIIFLIILWILLIFEIIFTEYTQYWNPLSLMGYSKLLLSLIKYSPAVYWNYKRKSTLGWSFCSIITDLIGGLLSIVSGSLSIQNGLNITKLALAILTVVYDIIFIVQHTYLYKRQSPKQGFQHQKESEQQYLQKQLK